MTRENKLALVVGFGLILFVGILISDHFSIVRNQRPADLTRSVAIDPLVLKHTDDSTLIDVQQPDPKPAVSPGRLDNPQTAHNDEPVTPEQRSDIVQANLNGNGPTPIVPPGENAGPPIPPGFQPVVIRPLPPNVKVHEVRTGESFFAICRQHYGNGNLAMVKALAKYNGIDDPASLKVGQRVLIPTADVLNGHAPAAPSSAPPAAPSASNSKPNAISPPPTNANMTASLPPSMKVVGAEVLRTSKTTLSPVTQTIANTYTVKAGDSLAQIAQRFLGSKLKWKKIHDLNRDVIDDPDNLKVGTVLKLS